MKNKGIGFGFCLIAALLFCTRYLAAAVFMSNVSSWNKRLFESALEYVGTPLKTLSILSLVVGVLFLAVGIFQELTDKKKAL